jgi:hypothetical protein
VGSLEQDKMEDKNRQTDKNEQGTRQEWNKVEQDRQDGIRVGKTNKNRQNRQVDKAGNNKSKTDKNRAEEQDKWKEQMS